MNVQQDHVLHSENGRFSSDTTTQLGDVARILDAASQSTGGGTLAVHFHGGLVKQNKGREIAERLASRYAAGDAYPLFFVWESGLFESLINNPKDVLNDKAFRAFVGKVSKWVLRQLGSEVVTRSAGGASVDETALKTSFNQWFDGGASEDPLGEFTLTESISTRSAGSMSRTDLEDEIYADIDGDFDFQSELETMRRDAETTQISDAAYDELAGKKGAVATRGVFSWISVAKFVAEVVWEVVQRYRDGRDHGPYCTIIEEVLRAGYLDNLGAGVWNQMKKDSADSFADHPEACGTEFIKQLDRLRASGQGFNRIVLIGHSTGAIMIAELLDAAQRLAPELRFEVVFLAPAITHEKFQGTVQNHLSGNDPRVSAFRSFAMTDDLEAEDSMIPILYTRSLLYFVSGLLEGEVVDEKWRGEVDAPIVGMERYQLEVDSYPDDGFPAIKQIRPVLDAARQAAWSPAEDADGLRSVADKHGDFDNDELTIKSLEHILKAGF